MITPIMPHPAALIRTKEAKTLVVTDLHIGWEIALSEKGIHVPTQAPKLLQRLKTIIEAYKPDTLLILGDVKHTVAKAEISEWQDVPDFLDKLKTLVKEIQIIRGNHDGNIEPLLPEDVNVLPSTGTIIGDVGLFHGHRWPPAAMLKCKTLVMGHIHPVISLRDPAGFKITRQVWVKAKCNRAQLAKFLLQRRGTAEKNMVKVKPKTLQIFIMPSFNDFLGGKPLNEKTVHEGRKVKEVLGPVIRSEAVNLENAEIYLLDGTFLGTLKQLRNLDE